MRNSLAEIFLAPYVDYYPADYSTYLLTTFNVPKGFCLPVCYPKGEVCTRFWWGNLRERDHWGDQDVDGRIILRWVFRKWEGIVGTGWSLLRIGIGGGRL